jgi:hypothetical protein
LQACADYYVAATLDGFIAHEDGSFDGFLWDDDYGVYLLASFPETFLVIVKLSPVIFGSGIPLLGPGSGQTPLKLTGSKAYPSGHAVLRYEVAR